MVTTSKTGTATETTDSSGRRTIKISSTIGKGSSKTSSKTSSSSSTPTARTVVRTERVGDVVTRYFSDGTSTTSQTTGLVGSATSSELAKAPTISKQVARVDGVYYSGLTPTEALRNELSPQTQAKKLEGLTRRSQEYKEAVRKFQSGEQLGTGDLLSLQGGVRKQVPFGYAGQKEQVEQTLKERKEFFDKQKEEKAKSVTQTSSVISTTAPSPVIRGEIRAATKEEIRAGQPVFKQIGEFKSGFQSFIKGDLEFIRRLKDDPSLTPAQRIGGVAAPFLTAGLTGLGSSIAQFTPVAQTFSSFGTLTGKIAKPVGVGLTAQAGTTFIAKSALPTELKQYETNIRVQDAYRKALEKVRTEDAGKAGVGGQILSGVYQTIPLTTAIFKKKEFQKAFQEELSKSGFADNRTPQEFQDATTYATARLARAEGGEFAAIIGAGATTEIIGSRALSSLTTKFKTAPKLFLKSDIQTIKSQAALALKQTLTKPGTDILKGISVTAAKQTTGGARPFLRKAAFKSSVFKEIATLGFAEGLTESIASDIAKDRKVDIRRGVATGLIAAPFAGVLGASIASSRGVRQKAKLGVAYVLDPSEPFGDVIAGAATKIKAAPGEIVKRTERAIISSPAFAATSILFSGAATPPPTPAITQDIKPSFDTRIRTSTITPSAPTTVVPAFGSIQTDFQSMATPTPTNLAGTPTNTLPQPTTLLAPSTVAVNVPTTVATSVPTSVTTSVATTVPTTVATTVPVTVATTVPTTVTTTVATITPQLPRIPLKFKTGKTKPTQGYNVMVKSGGKFVKANEVPLSYGDAISRGSHITDNTAAATFKLSKTNKPAKQSTQPSSSFLRAKFRGQIVKGKEKRSPTTFIEKDAYRIDSRGELQGVTAKGLLAQERARTKARMLPTKTINSMTGGRALKLQPQGKMVRNVGKAKLKSTRFKL